ncbi:helix-turn-helix transcriptional regulator [Chondrinema litorale]|uniref:helix-turn-helix transcriptional regulator n=1 Tax=Chondrinema litorale TaxID=2994555 RepID=UPI002543260E|nr:hypothetical protein [Chondrinema litorale]UZR95038.1 hypothetical protein OQ292_04315 [Chondrinema litorale]
MKRKRITTKILQIASFAVGGLMTFISVVEHHVPDGIPPFIMALLGIGIGSTVWLNKDQRKIDQINLLKYISNNHGRATLSELVIALEFPVEKVKKLLDKLEKHGAVTIEISQKGEIIYCCTDMLSISSEYFVS